MGLVMLPSLFMGVDDPGFWGGVFFFMVLAIGVWRSRRAGRVTFDGDVVEITRLGRTRRLRVDEIDRFEARVVPNGLRRWEVLFVRLADGSIERFNSVYAGRRTNQVEGLARELNVLLRPRA